LGKGAETRPRVGFSMPVGKMVGFALEQVKIYEEKKLEAERVAGARIFKNLANLPLLMLPRYAYLL